MIKFDDFDSPETAPTPQSFKFPEKVESLQVVYDRGRLVVELNGQRVFAHTGSSDFSLILDDKPLGASGVSLT